MKLLLDMISRDARHTIQVRAGEDGRQVSVTGPDIPFSTFHLNVDETSARQIGRALLRGAELPIDEVPMKMRHVPDCCCRYVASPLDANDVKLLDARCIEAVTL